MNEVHKTPLNSRSKDVGLAYKFKTNSRKPESELKFTA